MRVIVIGAGAAGLVAAGFAAERADEVTLVEHNDFVGKKLRITGKGRCNITNIADTGDMLAQYPRNSKFLYSALYSFTNNDIIS
ncbi:MAG: NAD(P)/FAD-dependent oxidoreductase, partial [Firmicutes bacterium]|nr:NAD(P)/FAD-dependent oxidoreductase [Bacillota bacterium]